MNRRNWLACMASMGSLLLSGCDTKVGAPQTTQFTPPPKPANPRFKGSLESVLEGTWEGFLARRLPLTPSGKDAPPDSSDLRIRLAIQHETVKVYLKDSGHWIEVMPGKFTFTRIVTSASMIGMNSSEPPTSGWIESWAFLVTAIDDDTLHTEWTRVVNNFEPGSAGLPTFSMAATGVLRRVSQ